MFAKGRAMDAAVRGVPIAYAALSRHLLSNPKELFGSRSISTSPPSLLPNQFNSLSKPPYSPPSDGAFHGASRQFSTNRHLDPYERFMRRTLDKTFMERETLNANIVDAINDVASQWGLTCRRYEIRDIIPPPGIRDSMVMQAEAERRKRAEIIEAEGKRQAVILTSEAAKMDKINRATGEAEAIRIIAESLQGQGGQAAASLKVAQDYVQAFNKLAKEELLTHCPSNYKPSYVIPFLHPVSVMDKTMLGGKVEMPALSRRISLAEIKSLLRRPVTFPYTMTWILIKSEHALHKYHDKTWTWPSGFDDFVIHGLRYDDEREYVIHHHREWRQTPACDAAHGDLMRRWRAINPKKPKNNLGLTATQDPATTAAITQWNKHGRRNPIYNQDAYVRSALLFDTIFKVRETVDAAIDNLQLRGIGTKLHLTTPPHTWFACPWKELQAELTSAFGVTPNIQVLRRDGRVYLYQISLSFTVRDEHDCEPQLVNYDDPSQIGDTDVILLSRSPPSH